MKAYVVILAAALTAILLMSESAQARRWVYPFGPYAHPRMLVRPIDPVFAPMTSTLVTPEVVVGPRGHLRYVAPI
jgi:hypothetical protein